MLRTGASSRRAAGIGRKSRRALLLALAMLMVTAANAQADSVAISFGPDPTEEVPIPITASWSSTSPDASVFVTIKPDGPLGCGSSYLVDEPNSSDLLSSSDALTGSTTKPWTIEDPGTSIVCGYLQDTYRDTSPLAVTGPVMLGVRSARASVAIQAPARVDVGSVFQLNVPVVTELRRTVIVTIKPAGGRGCEATYLLDEPNSSDVFSKDVQGNQSVAANVTASTTRGTYLLCAYVGESYRDVSPEAITAATFLVGPDPCIEARAQLTSATKAVKTAEASVARYRASSKRYASRAKRAHGSKRRSLQRLAKRDRSRYTSAVRRRAKVRATLGSAQATTRAACGSAAQR